MSWGYKSSEHLTETGTSAAKMTDSQALAPNLSPLARGPPQGASYHQDMVSGFPRASDPREASSTEEATVSF